MTSFELQQCFHRELITERAQTGDFTATGGCDEGMPAEGFPSFRQREVDFDDRQVHRFDGIVERDGRMGVRARIKDDSGNLPLRFMQTVNQRSFRIGLKRLERHLGEFFTERGIDVFQGFFAVNLGFAATQQIQVGSIED